MIQVRALTLVIVGLVVAASLVCARNAAAQTATTGSIAGVAKDASGGVLPGVTVETSSPALIEKTRTTVTNERGQYQLTDLRPGEYTVTFTLQGFAAFRREGIVLTSGFTATVDGEMKVGDLQETVTVSGESPMVDVRNVQTQNILRREHLDSLPTNRTLQGYSALTLGMSAGAAGVGVVHDVGGNKGEIAVRLTMHGSLANDGRYWLDGMTTNSADVPQRAFVINQVSAQEVNMTTDGASAEVQTSGVHVNVIPKSGGNNFSSYFSANFTNGDLQGSNLNDELRARGVLAEPKIQKIFDLGLGVGGPLMRDKLWFYTAHRYWGTGETVPGNYFNTVALQHTFFYEPDLSRPAFLYQRNRDNNVRLTYQATPNQRVSFMGTYQSGCRCYARVELNRAPEASDNQGQHPSLVQGSWTYTKSNSLLFEAGAQYMTNTAQQTEPPDVGNDFGDISVTETLGTATVPSGYVYNSNNDRTWTTCDPIKQLTTTVTCAFPGTASGRGSMSYVTGRHSFKSGVQWLHALSRSASVTNSDPPVAYQFRGGLPNRITYFAQPTESRSWNTVIGLFVQDQWTLQRVTLNLGLRFDSNTAGYPAQTRPASYYVGAIEIPAQSGVPSYKDFTPRVGAAWDLFGNGRTALKGYVGKFVVGGLGAAGTLATPGGAYVTNATRTWNDRGGLGIDGDFVPQESELGPFSAPLGSTRAVAALSDDLISGWGVRQFNWETAVALQHELGPGLSLNVNYARRWFGNFTVTDNLAVSPSDYDTYCVMAPADARLGETSGQQICGLFDLKPEKFGVTPNQIVAKASDYGKQSSVYNGVDLALNYRLGRGVLLGGGFSTGSQTTDNCEVRPDSPDKRFCQNTIGFDGQSQYKVQFVYPLPWWGLETSLVYQNLPGATIEFDTPASRSYSNAEIRPSLGRNLSACGATANCTASVTIPLVEPNTMREARLSQVDVRVTKSLRFGGSRLQLRADAYNLFNASPVMLQNVSYGPSFRYVSAFLAARIIKFGVQFDF